MGRFTYRRYSVPPPQLDETDRIALRQGMMPAYRRVWDNGVDVTDRPVNEWPTLMQESYANGWRPLISLDGTFMD